MPVLELWNTPVHLDQSRMKAWEELLSTFATPSPYMIPQWSAVLAQTYNWKPCHMSAMSDGRLVGLLPALEGTSFFGSKIIHALPFSHLTPPLARSPEIAAQLAQGLAEYAEQKGVLRIVFHSPSALLGMTEAQKPKEISGLHHWHCIGGKQVSVLNLNQFRETGNKMFSLSAMRNARKAAKLGVAVTESSTEESYSQLYRMILHTRRRQGVPPYPAKLFDALLSCSNFRLFCGIFHDRHISAMGILALKKRAIYLYGASYPDAFPLRANDYLFSRVITQLSEEGFDELDFGQTPDWHSELLRFKKKWGCTSTPLEHVVWTQQPTATPCSDLRNSTIGHIASACIHKTPLPVLAWCGKHFLKYLI